jgi:hypothetical protein
MKLNFSTDFRKIQIRNFMKICPVGAELFHVDGRTDRQTDMTKPIVCFSSRMSNSNITVGRNFGVWKLLPDKLQSTYHSHSNSKPVEIAETFARRT